MKRNLEKIYSKENIEKLLNKNSSIKELNEFDLKIEMINYPSLKNLYNDYIKESINLEFEELFNENYILERYIVYKELAKIKYKFDCDKLRFVKKIYGIKRTESCDTLLSIQSIYSKIISNKPFLEQLSTIDELKQNVYYNDICRLIIYYHTIGNMCPCPNDNNYNVSKYNQNKGGFDRLDLFKDTAYFKEKNFEKYFTKERRGEYCLEEIYNGDKLPNLEETNRIFEEKKEEKVKKYINTYIDLIIERTSLLYENNKLKIK